MNLELSTPITVILYALFGILAVAAVVFNARLRRLPEVVETIVHEVSHSLAALTVGGTLPLRITLRREAEAEVFGLTTTDSRIAAIVTAFGGYLGPIALGPTLIVLSVTPKVNTPFILFVLLGIFVALSTLFIFFPAARIFLTLALWLGGVVLLIAPPELMTGGTAPGPAAAALIIVAIYAVSLIGLWNHLFTVWKGDSLRSLGFLIVATVAVVGLFFFPFLAGPVAFSLGIFLTLSGGKTIFTHRQHGGDFFVLSESLGGTPLRWFVVFCFSVPLALAVVARVLFVLTG
ncbi:M50 family metallopeptidase [Leucobacter sp. cx-42]|uniref:M50 family metallopeptidase n=1 Tax=unclassified Leucobacter TaxID=2621730 RepID=UPI00165D4341|nr:MULTISPECIES: M50 family metallopeptidase [unclassified Leucobacter]MBC9954068.1 M50 family metallopeptidase [Leucobacter sp. cx-42]